MQAIYTSIRSYLSKKKIKSPIDKISVCAWLYNLMENNRLNSQDSANVFQFFLEHADDIDSDESDVVKAQYSKEDLDHLEEEYGKLTDAILEKTLIKGVSKAVFYQQLWNGMVYSSLFDTIDSKIFFIYYIWIDVRIPYFELNDGLKMSDQEFKKISQNVLEDIKKARFIIRTNKFKSRTEQAAVLLELIDSYEDNEKERTVLFAHIVNFLQKSAAASRLEEMLEKFSSD